MPAPTQPSNAVNNLVQTEVESTTGSKGGETYSPIFEGQFDFELSTGLQINKEDVLTGRPLGDSLRNLDIVTRSNKIAFDQSGEIVYRASMGKGSTKDWESLFQELTK